MPFQSLQTTARAHPLAPSAGSPVSLSQAHSGFLRAQSHGQGPGILQPRPLQAGQLVSIRLPMMQSRPGEAILGNPNAEHFVSYSPWEVPSRSWEEKGGIGAEGPGREGLGNSRRKGLDWEPVGLTCARRGCPHIQAGTCLSNVTGAARGVTCEQGSWSAGL